MQYENDPANGFRDIVRKQNTDAQTNRRTDKQTHGRKDARPDMVMTTSGLGYRECA